ncbi:MAG: RraA family protein [Chloroflexi bacterium]|nr:RraA family protein [Chloroflexota bacterium]
MADAQRPEIELTDRLRSCYSGAVYDAMRDLGLPPAVLPSSIRPLDPGTALAGPIWPCEGRPDQSADDHDTLLGWTRLLSAAPAGAVVVCQPNDSTIAHMGELSAEALRTRGVLGYFVDGGCRDTEFIINRGFPVFCRYRTPSDVVGRWVVETLGEPIRIGEVDINAGDFLLADIDGAVVIPADSVNAVTEAAEKLISTESEMRRAILAGMDPSEAYLKYGVF